MTDIIVTTPKSEIKNAAAEARECIANGGGWYFRRLHSRPRISTGDRVWYVEDGYLRGYAICNRLLDASTREGQDELRSMGLEIIPECEVTGKNYGLGLYVFMRAETWMWIKPIPMTGFQGWRYVSRLLNFEIVGNWLDPKPR